MRLSSTLLALGAAAVLCGGLVGCTSTDEQSSSSAPANAPVGNTAGTAETATATTLEVPAGMESAVLNAKGMT